ncbi:hypothetical protein [Poseidonocella sedimentorum]|uniref:PAAR motif-containing protein n=1 Tax=Poseidonocella sedimentorum TaxID=871652 RepID=A0A1I6DP55_9RHOB|nr:hypothetical protein [Poseidonocella sedimentorum]SFR07273.1 hypothetical protein SAMN04515673_104204 [Poseidonocella sedimentorum]
MPGPMLHIGATVLCAHGGQAQPTVPNPRVLVSGQPTVLQTAPWVVAGCAMPPPPAGNGPCVTASFVTGSLRVSSLGQPFVLMDSQSIAAPTGTPLLPAATQTRVIAT